MIHNSPALFPQGKFPFITSATVHGLGLASWLPAASSLYRCTRDVSFALSADIFVRSLDRCFDDSEKHQERNS